MTNRKQRRALKEPSWYIADRIFFKTHPNRDYRLRLLVKGEFDPQPVPPPRLGNLNFVVVQCVARIAGNQQMRMRHAVDLPTPVRKHMRLFDDSYLDQVPISGVVLFPKGVMA